MQICGHLMLSISRIKHFMYHGANAQNSHKFVWDWKIKNEIPALTWLAESWDLNIMENLQHVNKLKLETEIEVIKMWAKYIDAVCRIWRSPRFEVIPDPYAFISNILCYRHVGY